MIEDNPDDRELMKLAFAQGNIPHSLVVVANGIKALGYLFGQDSFNTNVKEYDVSSLIILDLNLPKINGIEVLKRIRAHPKTKLIPVFTISALNKPQGIMDSYINGCNSYIRKPIHFTQLQIFVREISTYWLTINHFPPVFGVLNE